MKIKNEISSLFDGGTGPMLPGVSTKLKKQTHNENISRYTIDAINIYRQGAVKSFLLMIKYIAVTTEWKKSNTKNPHKYKFVLVKSKMQYITIAATTYSRWKKRI